MDPAVRRPVRSAGPGRGIPPLLVLWCCLVGGTGIHAGTTSGGAVAAFPDSSVTAVEREVRLVDPRVQRLRLAHPFVVPGSVVVRVDGRLWREGRDYALAPLPGDWIPRRPLGDPLGPPVRVEWRYRFVPAPLPPDRVLHPIRGAPAATPSAAAGSLAVTAPPVAATGMPGDLTVRGSKTVRLASGTNRDMTVDQNLRLTISGHLTDRIAVQAQLADDNLPVVPEGNTEQLRDIDRVRVAVTAPAWEAALGDLVADVRGTALADYRRKLQGVTVRAHGDSLTAGVVAGSPRGRYRTVQFRGEEGNQGPYYLRAASAGEPLFLVAGSERVVLDGEPLVRGADRDYVIDYVQGTVTFTYRRPITADSEIVVEFEEGEGPYARTVAGADAAVARPLGEGLTARLAVRLVGERDDPDRLRTGELSPADRALLAAAGDDPGRAVADGITPADPGAGLYRLEDHDGITVAVFDSLTGDHDVTFYAVDPGRGDYRFDHLTAAGDRVYVYAGPDQGDYRIGRPLPLPVSHQLLSLRGGIGPDDSTGLHLEWDTSRRDANVLAAAGDDDDTGHALALHLDSGDWRPVGGRWGRFRFRARHQVVESRYRPFLLARRLFTYDAWGLGQRALREGFLTARDRRSEATLGWSGGGARGEWRLAVAGGSLAHGASLTADRFQADLRWRWRHWQGLGRWGGAHARDRLDPLDVTRRVREQAFTWTAPALRPAFRWRLEQDSDAAAVAGWGAAGSRRRSWRYGLTTAPASPWNLAVAFTRGLADSLRDGNWRRERDSRTVEASLATPGHAALHLTAAGTWRRVERPAAPATTTRLGKVELAGRWDRIGSDWSLRYQLDRSRTPVLDRQVVYVGFRQGDYDQAGNFVGRLQGDYQVVTAPTDSSVATTGVAADLQWRQDFGWLGPDRLWGAWRTTTNLGVHLQSVSDDAGAVLRLSPDLLFDPATTVFGEVDWRQRVELLRHLPRWQLDLRRDFHQSLDRRFAAHPERRLRRFSEVLLVWHAATRTSWRLRRQWTDDDRATTEAVVVVNRSHRSRERRWELAWSWRPSPGNRVEIGGDHVTRHDAVADVRQRENGLALTAQQRWHAWLLQARGRWSRVDTPADDPLRRPFFYPYPGTNVETTLRLAWNPTNQLTLSLSWFGRRRGERGWQHDLRMESTARF